MKKILTAGMVSLALAAVPVVGVFAEGSIGENTHDVTVGEVTEPIYSVDITWSDMSYDWVYNTNTESYGFRAKMGCAPVADGPVVEQALQEIGNLYEDSECLNLFTGEIDLDDHTYHGHRTKYVGSGGITVIDSSTNGKIMAEASFTPTDNYNWVIGKFGAPRSLYIEEEDMNGQMGLSEYYGFAGYDAINDSIIYDELENNKLPVVYEYSGPGVPKVHKGYLYLENNSQISRNNVISSDDVIGTVTVTISPDTN